MKTMTKTEFFRQYGGSLHKVANDDSQYGDFLILHPEEIDLAKGLEERGLIIVSVHESGDGNEDIVEMENDYGNQPFKYGYFAIDLSNHELF